MKRNVMKGFHVALFLKYLLKRRNIFREARGLNDIVTVSKGSKEVNWYVISACWGSLYSNKKKEGMV